MKPVAKLWYNSQGELRLLKEWINKPSFKVPNTDMGCLEAAADHYMDEWYQWLKHAESESIPVVNADEVLNAISLDVVKQDRYYDLPGATWEEQRSRVESDEIFYAYIHLPKERGAGDDNPVINYFEQASVPREVFRAAQDDLAAAYKRIEEELERSYERGYQDAIKDMRGKLSDAIYSALYSIGFMIGLHKKCKKSDGV